MRGVFFPWLHSELVRPDLLPGVGVLNFGLPVGREGSDAVCPSSLPLQARDLEIFLGQSMKWGEQFVTPYELKTFSQDKVDFFAGTSMAIRDEFLSRARDRSLSLAEAQAAAQRMLALCWSLEEQVLELSRLKGEIDSKWVRLREVIGLEEADNTPVLPGAGWSPLEMNTELTQQIPFARVMSAFLLLIPLECFIYFELDALKEDLREAGLRFSAPGSSRTQSLQLPEDLPQVLVSRSGIDDLLPWLGQDDLSDSLRERWSEHPIYLVCDFS